MLEYYIWLNELKGIRLKDKKCLLKYFKNPRNIYEASILDIPEEYKDNETLIEALGKKDLYESNRIIEINQRQNIKALTIDNPLYLSKLNYNDSFPLVLYYKGRLGANKSVAIVGTRKATEYGKKVARLTAMEYINDNTVIISGLAIGIDSIAHQTAIKMGGTTYAFIANGLDRCYPNENIELMKAIENQGAVISLFPIGTPPRKYQFILRNKLMCNWSDEVLVVEGNLKSGAVITGEFAIKSGKTVYAVPNSIFINTSSGCNELIAKGAAPYVYKGQVEDTQGKYKRNNMSANRIIDALKGVPLSTQELYENLDISFDGIKRELFILELDDQVSFHADGRWYYKG